MNNSLNTPSITQYIKKKKKSLSLSLSTLAMAMVVEVADLTTNQKKKKKPTFYLWPKIALKAVDNKPTKLPLSL